VNAFVPILVTEDGMVMDVNDEHLENALEPILITEVGMVMDVNDEHS
jgi:hypothetical protein